MSLFAFSDFWVLSIPTSVNFASSQRESPRDSRNTEVEKRGTERMPIQEQHSSFPLLLIGILFHGFPRPVAKIWCLMPSYTGNVPSLEISWFLLQRDTIPFFSRGLVSEWLSFSLRSLTLDISHLTCFLFHLSQTFSCLNPSLPTLSSVWH